MKSKDDLLEMAWGIIANAGAGNWARESIDWQDAAARWRNDYQAALAAHPAAASTPALKNLVVAAVRLAIGRHDLATDDCPTIGDEDAKTIAEDVWGALNGIGTCDEKPAPELLALAARPAAADAGQAVTEEERAKVLEAIRCYSVYAQSRGSAPFGATPVEKAALAVLLPPPPTTAGT